MDAKTIGELWQLSAAAGVLGVVYLILKEIFSFLKGRKPVEVQDQNNSKTTAFWEMKIDKIVEERLDKFERKMQEHFERVEELIKSRAKGAGV